MEAPSAADPAMAQLLRLKSKTCEARIVPKATVEDATAEPAIGLNQ